MQKSKIQNNDLLINTSLYGIYNPKNFHSFYPSHKIFIPKPCLTCKEIVFPLNSACFCLRCSQICHRDCVRKAPKCVLFTFKFVDDAKHLDINSISDMSLVLLAEKALMIPVVLGYIPKPKSEYCIWRSILRAIALKDNEILNFSFSPDLKAGDEEEQEVFKRVKSILDDEKYFPSQVLDVAFNVFISLNIEKQELFLHARECIDTIVCSFLNICASAPNHKFFGLLNFAIEDFIMKKNSGIFYEKLKLSNPNKDFDPSSLEVNKLRRIAPSIIDIGKMVSTECSTISKLRVVVNILKEIVKVLTISKKKNDISGNKIKTSQEIKLETDDLLELFSNLIVLQLKEKSVDWLWEYSYIDSMLLKEGDGLLFGPEGYAFASLQQCILNIEGGNIINT